MLVESVVELFCSVVTRTFSHLTLSRGKTLEISKHQIMAFKLD